MPANPIPPMTPTEYQPMSRGLCDCGLELGHDGAHFPVTPPPPPVTGEQMRDLMTTGWDEQSGGWCSRCHTWKGHDRECQLKIDRDAALEAGAAALEALAHVRECVADYEDVSPDDCQHCGSLSMCAVHSLLSALKGRTANSKMHTLDALTQKADPS